MKKYRFIFPIGLLKSKTNHEMNKKIDRKKRIFL